MERHILRERTSHHVFFWEPTLAPPCKLYRQRCLWSAACPSFDSWFSALSKSACVVLITSGYTPVGPDCHDALSSLCFLITIWQLVKAHEVTRNELKIHIICYITLLKFVYNIKCLLYSIFSRLITFYVVGGVMLNISRL